MAFKHNATQFSSSGEKKSDIVIGFDFGTSCTKIVLQDPILRKAYAVPFGEKGYPNNAYLLPTKIGVTKQGQCTIAPLDKKGWGGLKVGLMNSPERKAYVKPSNRLQTNISALASAYIALGLRHSRAWFSDNFQRDYGGKKIRWHLNLGIPAKNYDDESIYHAFLRVAYAAWWLSIQDGPITVSKANKAFAAAKGQGFDPGLNPDFIHVVPEVAAAVASYARSHQRQTGLHMIVDIGASTMDIATFRLELTEAGYEYYFLWADVCGYACNKLHQYRLQFVIEHLKNWFSKLQRLDGISQEVPDTVEKYYPPPLGLSLDQIDGSFLSKAKMPFCKVAAVTYKRRDPNAQEWKLGVPLFLCGGGANLRVFRELLVRETQESLKIYNISDFQTRSLTKPDNLEASNLQDSEYHRLAVAYGLSFYYDDIGKIVPPSEIEDIERTVPTKVVEPITKEMV